MIYACLNECVYIDYDHIVIIITSFSQIYYKKTIIYNAKTYIQGDYG